MEYIWVFDENRRVYPKEGGRCIWREHWVKRKVVGETKRSWILEGYGRVREKVSKSSPLTHLYAFSEEEVSQKAWVHDNAIKICERVRNASYQQLMDISKIINYGEQPNE